MPSHRPTRGYHHHHGHRFHVFIPLFTAFIWFSTVLAMLITWLASGRPHYSSMSPDQTTAFISDVGADILKPLFVVACVITGLGFFLSLVIERWMRHRGRLMPNMRKRERVFSSLAILGAFIGGVGLILLSIFDTKRHSSLHRLFLLIFILGVALSALFTCLEFRWLSRDFGAVRTLRIAYLMKAVIATLLILLAIAFGILLKEGDDFSDSHPQAQPVNKILNDAAIVEWTIAFGYTLYLLTFWWDLRHTRSASLSDERLMGYGGGMRQVPPM